MTPTLADELLPCPFCGGPACLTRFDQLGEPVSIHVSRIECGNDDRCPVTVEVRQINEAVAIKAWNTRTPPGEAGQGQEFADSSGPNPGAIGASKGADALTGVAPVASAPTNSADAPAGALREAKPTDYLNVVRHWFTIRLSEQREIAASLGLPPQGTLSNIDWGKLVLKTAKNRGELARIVEKIAALSAREA